VNKSAKVKDSEVENDLPAFQQATEYFEKYWGGSVKLVFTNSTAPPKGAWVMTIKDVLDDPMAYGYHDVKHGVPYSMVGTDGSWTITFTHELFEMLADPFIDRLSLAGSTPYLVEVGDPVESNQFAFTLKNTKGKDIKLSDFVYPQYYRPGAKGPYDFGHYVDRPLQLLMEGYISWWTPYGWEQDSNSTHSDTPPREG